LNNGLCNSPVDSITVTINAAPGAPTPGASSYDVCANETLPQMMASGAGTIEWYTDRELNNLFETGNSVTADLIVDTTRYYIVSVVNGCYGSAIDSIDMIIHPVPVISA